MDNILIQKTHYEMVKELIENKRLFQQFDLQTFMASVKSSCGPNPAFDEFTESPFIQQLATLGLTPIDQSQITVFANVLYHLYQMRSHFERIYYMCPKLAVDLSRTELNVDTRFLKSPFPEIYIQIDPGLYFIHDEAGDHPVRGFYVNVRETGDTKLIRVMAAALKSNYKDLSVSNDDALFYFRITLGPGKIKDELQKYLEGTVKKNEVELKKFGGYYNLNHIQEMFLFVFNTLLYITSKDADIIRQLPLDVGSKVDQMKSKAKIRKLLQRQSKVSSLPILIIGSKFISTNSVEQIKSAGGVGKWKLDKKVYVSGHWRTQWYGSEKDDTRRSDLLFIQPYEKGPELAEVIDRRYQVGTV